MSEHYNNLDQSVGFPLADWQHSEHPRGSRMSGRFCELVPLEVAAHAADLFDAFALDSEHRNWTYLPYGPFLTLESFQQWLAATCLGDDPTFFAVLDKVSNEAVGMASYLRITPAAGVVEVGHIHFSPLIQGRPAATEAMYLMLARIFDDLGYRRYEWKCDALNAPSCRAARRLGFMFEGIFRQATIYKGRNRDTAWFSIVDSEWPLIKIQFDHWLDAANFDLDGNQKTSLSKTMAKALASLRQD